MNDSAARLAESEAAKAAWDRFLGPALEVARLDYLEKLAEAGARPMTEQNQTALIRQALALKVLDQVKAQLVGLIADGAVARAEQKTADRLDKMPEEARRWATY